MTTKAPHEPDPAPPTIIDLSGGPSESTGVLPEPGAPSHRRVVGAAAFLVAVVAVIGFVIGGSDDAADRTSAPVEPDPTPGLVPAPDVAAPAPTPISEPTAVPTVEEELPQRDSRSRTGLGATLRLGADELAAPVHVHRTDDTARYTWFTVGPGLRLEANTWAPAGVREIGEDLVDTAVGGRALASVGDGLVVEPDDPTSGSLAYWVLESGLTPLRDGSPGDVRFLGASGGLVAIVDSDGRVAIIEVWTGDTVSTARLAGPAATSACFSPDQSSLALVYPDAAVTVIDVASGAVEFELQELGAGVGWTGLRQLAHLVPDGSVTWLRVADVDSGAVADAARFDGTNQWILTPGDAGCPGAAPAAAGTAGDVAAIAPLRTITALAAPITLLTADGSTAGIVLDATGALADTTLEGTTIVDPGIEIPPNTYPVARVGDGLILVNTNTRITTLDYWTPATDRTPLTNTQLGQSTFVAARDDTVLVITGDELVGYDVRTDAEIFRAPADHLGARIARGCFNHDQTALAVVTGRGQGAIFDLTTGLKRRGYTTDAVIGGGFWTTADQFVWLEASDGARLVRAVDLSTGLARNVARLEGAGSWELAGSAGVC